MARTRFFLTLLVLVLLLAACSQPRQTDSGSQPAPQQAPAPQEQAATQAEAGAPAGQAAAPQAVAPAAPAGTAANPRSAPSASKPAAPTAPSTPAGPAAASAVPSKSAAAAAPPAPPKPVYVAVPVGTVLPIRLSQSLSTANNQSGDAFEGTLDSDVEVDGHVIWKRGTPVQGKVTHAERSGRVEGKATMSVDLTSIGGAQDALAVRTAPLSFTAASTTKKDATKVGIAAGIGTAIGAIAGGGKGAAVGAAIGGGAGTGAVLATRGKEIELSPESKLNFKLNGEVQVRVK